MLAEFVVAHKQELVEQVALHAAADEGPGPAKGRANRVNALVEELIATLQRSDGSPAPQADTGQRSDGSPAPQADTGRDGAIQCHERSLIRDETVSAVVSQSLTVPPSEMAVLSDWASAPNQHRLEERARRLSDLLDDIHEAAVIVTPDGRIEYLNRLAALFVHDATGVPMDQLLGKTGRELGLPEDVDFSSHPEMVQTLARQRASREEFMAGRWWKTRYRAISSEGGDLVAIAFVHSDIHEHKRAELRLELLARFSAIVGSADYEDVCSALASIPVPEIADWCAVNLVEDGRITRTAVSQSDPSKTALRDAVMRAAPEWNENPLWTQLKLTRGFQLLTDVSDEWLRKITINGQQYEFMKQVGVQSIMVQPVISRRQTIAIFTFMYTTESGRRYDLGDPELAGELALHAAHIIDNARLLRDLRKTEARFRVALGGARTAVFEQDASLRYTWHYSPFVPVSLLGRTDEDVFPADEAANLSALKRRVMESGESISQELALTIGGERGVYRESLEAMHDHAGKAIGIIGSATDITEEKQTQHQLGQALGFRDRMMGVLGHDLRNPLNAAKGAAATVLRRDLPKVVREKVAVIDRAADRMTEMIETLLDLARVRGQGGLPVTRVPTDLGAIAAGVASELAAAFPNRALQVEARGQLQGRWDPARVGEAISNLLANALEHGDPRMPVDLSVDGSGEAVVTVKVRNDGPPIPLELRSVLFEPFSRASTSPHGLGLGLFIVKEIAAAHGGSVDVESSAEAGTAFTLVLPREA
jgi:PAS domain S-box-containing protein